MLRVRPSSHRLALDVAQLVLEETLRGAIPPEDPEILRFLGGLGWRFEQRLTPVRAHLMAEEVRRCFGCSARASGAVVREAQDLALQARLERLVVPKMSRSELDRIVRVDGAALSSPSVYLFPHAGNPLLLVAALAVRLPGLVVFGGRAPEQGSPARRLLVQRRRAEQDRLPVHWETDPSALPGWLQSGHSVAAAFDDRKWRTFERIPFLGREALLSPEPFALLEHAEGCFVRIERERDKTSRVIVRREIPTTLAAFIEQCAEPALRACPGHYASWLAERRINTLGDDHPLFVDYAADDRWRRWPLAG